MFNATVRHALKTALQNIKLRPTVPDKMAASEPAAEKRSLDDAENETEIESKKMKVDDEQKLLKRKVAMLMMYSGVGYLGMQRNPPFPTIEEDLLKALLATGCIPETHFETPQKMQFQRAARTDKGVSAAGQLVSLKLWFNFPNLVDRINQHLPDQIRVVDILRTTNSFNSKNNCSHRTYSYLIPTYAFTPMEKLTLQSNRVDPGVIDKVNEVLQHYVGTHNFHNFTSGKKPNDASAKRYIMHFNCSQPFVREGIEFALITVKGQSFMLHQIRKMIGLMIAIVRGHTNVGSIQQAYQYPKFDVPKAPGLGLMLEYVHYDRYNIKFGSDQSREKIEWEPYFTRIEDFKEKFIYSAMIAEEKKEKVMLTWMDTLICHKYESKTEEDGDGPDSKSPFHQAKSLVWRVVTARKNEEKLSPNKSGAKTSDKEKTENKNDNSVSDCVKKDNVDSVKGEKSDEAMSVDKNDDDEGKEEKSAETA